MPFIEPMNYNKPHDTYLLTYLNAKHRMVDDFQDIFLFPLQFISSY